MFDIHPLTYSAVLVCAADHMNEEFTQTLSYQIFKVQNLKGSEDLKFLQSSLFPHVTNIMRYFPVKNFNFLFTMYVLCFLHLIQLSLQEV